jgi:hypothetical protein
MRFRIWWMMAAVAVVAVLLSLPIPLLFLLVLPASAAVAIILVSAALAPRGRRVEAAYWALAVHPMAILAWLAVWRFFLDPRTLQPKDEGWYFALTLSYPYFMALLSLWNLPLLLAFAVPLALNQFAGRRLAIPLLLTLIVWFSTAAVLERDPFRVSIWFWD